jgi:hypothetical protein
LDSECHLYWGGDIAVSKGTQVIVKLILTFDKGGFFALQMNLPYLCGYNWKLLFWYCLLPNSEKNLLWESLKNVLEQRLMQPI